MIRKLKNKGGETITETIIAISILAIGITFSSTLMANSLININVSKNRFVAVNIAREGIEAMRNIRDTNWLKFSSNRRTCWNHMPQENIPDNCEDSIPPDGVSDTPIEAGEYIIYKGTDHRWRLMPAEDDTDPENIIDNTPLFAVDINGDGVSDMYNHVVEGALIKKEGEGAEPENTVFKRKITVRYLDDDGSDGNEENNRMLINAEVTWLRGDVERTVELKTHLTDYLGRDNLSN